MQKRLALTGNDAGAYAFRQVNPDAACAFPITPQTELMHAFSQYVADGAVDTELVCVESEHSAMSASVGAAAAGCRTITATSANGLALMWEIVYIAASTRLPIVMAVINRALSGPINIHCDHSDTMGARDSGWIQLFSENAQEVYDNLLQAFRIGEHPEVLLPVMVTLDGFILSHTMEVLDVLPDEEVQEFIGEYTPKHTLLDIDNPITVGPLDLQDYYFEHKRQEAEGMEKAPNVILDVGRDYGNLTGRTYGFFEEYRLEDAETAVIVLGSTAGTAKEVVDQLRDEGQPVGLLKLRTFRPFPARDLAATLGHLKALGVMDRSISFGGEGGPVFTETRSALFGNGDAPLVTDYIYGLGGRDIGLADIRGIFDDLAETARTGEIKNLVTYVGVRE
jgi:pyruvate ferredoxin oxidoreductase alpha subunit